MTDPDPVRDQLAADRGSLAERFGFAPPEPPPRPLAAVISR
jgi:hypothetical protein